MIHEFTTAYTTMPVNMDVRAFRQIGEEFFFLAKWETVSTQLAIGSAGLDTSMLTIVILSIIKIILVAYQGLNYKYLIPHINIWLGYSHLFVLIRSPHINLLHDNSYVVTHVHIVVCLFWRRLIWSRFMKKEFVQ